MSDFFQTLENEYKDFMATINNNVGKLPSQNREAKDISISETQQHLREVEKCLKQMEIETMPFSENIRKELNQKIRKYRNEYDDARRKFMKAEEIHLDEKGKLNLLGSRSDDDARQSKAPETLLDSQNRKLQEAKKTGFITMEIAQGTNTELNRQSEVLIRNRERLGQMDSDLSESNNLVKQMQRRILKNKMTLYGVLGVIGLSVILIVYSYF